MRKTHNKADSVGKTILYDGDCTVCQIVIKKVDNSSSGKQFTKQDIHSGKLPTRVVREQAEKEMHVIGPDGKIYIGADAILQIIDEYPRWRWLATLGRMPGVIQLLRIVYRFVSANRHFLLGEDSRIYWLKVVLVLGMASGLLLSPSLWTGQRFYPTAPVLSFLPTIPATLGQVALGAMLALLLGVLLSARPQRFIAAFLSLAAILVLFDQSRLQPWFYQYCIMFGALVVFKWKPNVVTKRNAVMATCMLIISGIYIYSGLQKFNPNFTGSVFPWMIEPVANKLPQALQSFVYNSGQFIPVVEISIGLGLLFKRTRVLAFIVAVGMHLNILYVLGPFGNNWNSVVWPWNITMILIVGILFFRNSAVPLEAILWTKKFIYHKVALVLFGLLPLLSFVGLWDSYLSSSLYSGNTTQASLNFPAYSNNPNRVDLIKYATLQDKTYNVDFNSWSFAEMNVPAYPETRIYKQITKKLCKTNPDLELKISPRWTSEWPARSQYYGCNNL